MFVVRRVVTVAVMAAVFGLTACARVPQPAIDQASEALAAAGRAEASNYAAAQWDIAQQAMNAARAEIEVQKAKFALLRSYDKAGELLAAAQQEAVAAREAGIDGKERRRAEVENSIAAIEASLAQAQQLLGDLASCGKRPKGFATDLALLRGKVETLDLELGELRSSADSESFVEAGSLAESLGSEVEAVMADLANAKLTLGC
jgi:hypothetical protein